MTHLMVEDDLQAQIEATRMDIRRLWPENLNHALAAQLSDGVGQPVNMDRHRAVLLIARLTLAIENGVIQ